MLRAAFASGVSPNACSVENVRYSLLRSPAGTALLLLNGNSREVSGEIRVPDAFQGADLIYGDAGIRLDPGRIGFSLPADETAIVRLDSN